VINSKSLLPAVIFVILSLFLSQDLIAQRNIDYRQLVMRNQQDPVSVDQILLPGSSDSTVTMATVFSLPYSYLPFKKGERSNPDKEFYSATELNIEVFKSSDSDFNKKKKEINLKGLEPVARAFWSDTAYAKSYSISQSRQHFLNGYLSTSLDPGNYSYVLQMRRGENTDSRISRTQTIRIPSFKDMETGNIIFGEKLVKNNGQTQLVLSSLGKNVPYTKDFYTFAYIPSFDDQASYSLQIANLNVQNEDTSKVGTVFSQQLVDDNFRSNIRPELAPKGTNETRINLQSDTNGFTYLLIKIPHEKLPNAMYRLSIKKEGQKKPVANDTFRSVWLDMPTSLLNLDVAIEMLHYIVDQKTLDRLSKGSQRKREQKFREFWSERDPTPNTEFNELMAEYYRRIDYAYENFTTENIMGYNSDQGEVYIKFGPPKNIERKFPTNGPTTEVWTYPSQKFVFQATTGFGDFKLVSNKSR